MRELYLCGAGNPEGVRLALRVNQGAGRWSRIVILDDDASLHGERQLGVPVVGGFSRLEEEADGGADAVNLVARTTAGRRKAGQKIEALGGRLVGMVSESVDLLGAEIAPDVLVYPGAHVGPEAVIHAGSVVFMGAAVGHEAAVGAGCVIASNAVLNARVILGDEVYIGAGAVILPEVEVGAGATIGAGAVVLSDVPAGATVAAPLSKVIARSGPATAEPQDLAGGLEAVWAELLGLERVQRGENFFDLGGTSLLALQMLQAIEERFGVSLDTVDVFQYPTISQLADHMRSVTTGSPAPGVEAAIRRGAMRRALRHVEMGRVQADEPAGVGV